VLSRRGSQLQFETVRDALVVTGCAALLIWAALVAGRAQSAPKPNPNGKYELILAGVGGTGTGTAHVSAKKIKIDGTFDDGHGNVLTLSAPKVPLDKSEYRFSGTGTLNGTAVNISGRLDPPDDPFDSKPGTPKMRKNWRLTATFATVDAKSVGRIVGQR
jgi:hypothetical protein